MKNPFRPLYEKVLSWSNNKFAIWILFTVALIESSIFPVPPDILLIAMSIARRTASFLFAFVCSIGSVMGGYLGYLLGYFFMGTVGNFVLNLYNAWAAFDKVKYYYSDNAFLWVCIAGFTPIPYKVFTIAAGVCRIDLTTFILASVLSRSARFFLVATIIYIFGTRAKELIEKYFNIFTIVLFILLFVGIYLLKKL